MKVKMWSQELLSVVNYVSMDFLLLDHNKAEQHELSEAEDN